MGPLARRDAGERSKELVDLLLAEDLRQDGEPPVGCTGNGLGQGIDLVPDEHPEPVMLVLADQC